MKNYYLRFIVFFAILAGTVRVSGAESQERLMEMVDKALRTTLVTTFYAENVTLEKKDQKIKITVAYKITPEGKRFRLVDCISSNERLREFENEDGVFLVTNRKESVAVQPSFSFLNAMFFMKISSAYFSVDAIEQYRLTSINRRGIPCHKITMITSSDPAIIRRAQEKMSPGEPPESLESQESLETFKQERYVSKIIFVVDPRNYFIYSATFYTADGRIIYQTDFGKVNFSPEFPDHYFQLPPAVAQIVPIKTLAELPEVGKEYYQRDKVSFGRWLLQCLAAPFHWLDRNMENILQGGSYVALWLGIACIAAIVVLKIKQRRVSR